MSETIAEQVKAIAPQVHAAVITNDAFFNPIQFIDEQMTNEHLKFALASNLVWALDSSIVNAAIGLCFDVARDVPGALNDIGQLCSFFTGTQDHESYWGEGNAVRLTHLLAMQEEVHDLGYRCAAAVGRYNWQPRPLIDLARNQRVQGISGIEVENLDTVAAFVAEQSQGTLTADVAKKQLMEQMGMRRQKMADLRASLYPAVGTFVLEAQRRIDRDAHDYSYTKLSTQQRMFFTQMQLRSIDQAMVDLVRLPTTTFALVMAEAAVARKAYARVQDKLARDLEAERHDASY